MISSPSSKTRKSRTFSQISAKERGSSVPSAEYAAIRSWIRCASGRRASRVRMRFLAYELDAAPCIAGNVMNSIGQTRAQRWLLKKYDRLFTLKPTPKFGPHQPSKVQSKYIGRQQPLFFGTDDGREVHQDVTSVPYSSLVR